MGRVADVILCTLRKLCRIARRVALLRLDEICDHGSQVHNAFQVSSASVLLTRSEKDVIHRPRDSSFWRRVLPTPECVQFSRWHLSAIRTVSCPKFFPPGAVPPSKCHSTDMARFLQAISFLLLCHFSLALKFDLVAQPGHGHERCIRNFVNKDTLVVVTAIVSGNRGDGQMVNIHVRVGASCLQPCRYPGRMLTAHGSRSRMPLATTTAVLRTSLASLGWHLPVWLILPLTSASRTR